MTLLLLFSPNEFTLSISCPVHSFPKFGADAERCCALNSPLHSQTHIYRPVALIDSNNQQLASLTDLN